MGVVDELQVLGGVASWSSLRRRCTRRQIERSVAVGDVLVDARGRYALPLADDALRAAARLGGHVSGRSAALAWGWALARTPSRVEVTVPKHRRVTSMHGVELSWADLSEDDVDGLLTNRTRTIADCLRRLPFDEALAVADSALRCSDLSQEQLSRIAAGLRGPGSAAARRVASLASRLAANPFESVLRALALDTGLRVRPQVSLFADRFLGQPDLVDEELRVVLEADSFAWHGDRAALRRDTRRYNAFVRHGWLVLRFSWEDVMHDQDYVRELLGSVAQGWTDRRCWACGAG